jgi:cell shape-determining protein MreC
MGRERISNNHWFSGTLIIVIALLIFFAPSYGWAIRSWLSPAPVGTSQADNQMLTTENDALRAQLAQLAVVEAQLPTSTAGEVRAMVYSRYPMNFRNELLVNVGSNSGIVTGAAAVFQGMLIGQVKTVFPDSAVVQTIFDNTLKMPVRIGGKGTDGLLQGGSYPTVGSIASGATIMPGDIVVSAVSRVPYGLPVARVTATSTSADSLFQQATLSFPYDINNIETVFIIKK